MDPVCCAGVDCVDPIGERKARVFISHSSLDKDAASALVAWLREQGFKEIFLDFDQHHGIPPGEDWERKLYSEIQRATAVVLLLTRNWFDSKWCFAEFTQARSLGKSVLPVVVTDDGNQFIGDSLLKIDLLKNREGGLSRLLDRLRNISLDGPAGLLPSALHRVRTLFGQLPNRYIVYNLRTNS